MLFYDEDSKIVFAAMKVMCRLAMKFYGLTLY